MNVRWFIALTMLTGAALAQGLPVTTTKPAEVISGKANPELIPEWVALHSVVVSAAFVDAKYEDGAVKFARVAGISDDAARTVIAYQKAEEAANRSDTSLTKAMCPKRAQLLSKEALNAEIARFNEAERENVKTRVEGIYSMLSTEDAENLKSYALKQRVNSNLIKSDDTVDDPADYLNELCGA